MKNIIQLTMLAAMLAFFASCHKDEITPDTPQDTTPALPAPNEVFLGEYDLTIHYDTYLDDELQDMSGSWNGHLTIASDGTRSGVTVVGQVTMSGQNVQLYNAVGQVDSVNQQLTFSDSEFVNPSSGQSFTITYKPFAYAEPLEFESQLSTTMSGYTIRYVMANTASRTTK